MLGLRALPPARRAPLRGLRPPRWARCRSCPAAAARPPSVLPRVLRTSFAATRLPSPPFMTKKCFSKTGCARIRISKNDKNRY